MNGVLVVLVGFCLIFGEALFAWKDSFLTVAQMRARGLISGIPLLGHGGIWSDALMLTPMLAIITYKYANQWSAKSILLAAVVSLVFTIIMCVVWVKGGFTTPESLTHDGTLTIAGWLHAVYMLGALAIILLFYFATSRLTSTPVIIVSLILAAHVVIANHIPLSLIGPDWYNGRNYRDLSTWAMVIVIWGALTWRIIS